MPVQTTQPTIYSIAPRAFFLRDSDALQDATDPFEASLVDIRKGTLVISAWVDVTTSIGAAGAISLFHETGTTETVIVTVADGTATAITRNVDTDTGYEPIAGDGDIKIRKTGTGATGVFSVMCLLLRPIMTP